MLSILKRTPKERASDQRNQRIIAAALPKNYYQGTADEAKVAKRRAKNKAARKSRRLNRR